MGIAWNSHEKGAEVVWEIRWPGRIGPHPVSELTAAWKDTRSALILVGH